MLTLALILAVVLVLAAAAYIPFIRRKLATDRVLALYRRILPDMSQTEKEAIDAGTVWWDGDLFSGRPDFDKLLAVPEPRLSAEEQAFLDRSEERRVGKECRSRGARDHYNKKRQQRAGVVVNGI